MNPLRHEIKERLGYGGIAKLAAKLGVSGAHVSQVISGKRRSPRVEQAIVRRIGGTVDQWFASQHATSAAA